MSATAPLSGHAIQVRPFRRADRHQLTSLANGHLQSVGYIEVEGASAEAGRSVPGSGWADIGTLEVDQRLQRRGIGRWLLGEASHWFRLGHVDRLLAYADQGELAEQNFYQTAGFVPLSRTCKGWHRGSLPDDSSHR